ncbi:MAG: TauD/TfdA family dioxygenase [Acidobacteriota bacterium]
MARFDRLKGAKRRARTLDASSLVSKKVLGDRGFPLVIEPESPDVDLIEWIRSRRSELQRDLLAKGALLIRGGLQGEEGFQKAVAALTDRTFDFAGGAATRSRVGKKLYTSTEYPSHLPIRLHNEHCYSNDWPMMLFFFCAVAPEDRGQTPLAHSGQVYRAMPEEIRRRFEEKGVLYVRNYRHRHAWQSSYRTEDRREVEAVCRRAGRELEWVGEHELRTWEKRDAVRLHPITGEKVWFNFAHGFHVSRASDFESEQSGDRADDVLWPNTAFYGDGSEIDPADLDVVDRTIEENWVLFDWRVGDLVILDNMLVAHGRRPFSGQRRIMLQMAHRFSELPPQPVGYLEELSHAAG